MVKEHDAIEADEKSSFRLVKYTHGELKEVKLTGILSIKPEDEKRLNSYALSRFNDWQARILSKASQLRQLNIEQIKTDINTYLDDSDKAEFNKCLADITTWLAGCMDTGEGYFPNAYATWVTDPMFRVESLITKAYQAKEAEKRWNVAYKAVKPPLDDAKIYFTDGEFDEFIKASGRAIRVYMEKGESYLCDMRSFDYRWCLKEINDRKQKLRQKAAANLAAQEFNRQLNEEKARLKTLLSPSRKDHGDYFKKQVRDRRYTGQSFSQFLTKKEEEGFDRTLVKISGKKVGELVSADFHPFIVSKCWRSFSLLPSADYILEGIPCLNFLFDVFAVVETGVWLKPARKNFGDYTFDLPLREERGRLVPSKEAEFLGYHYLVLTPEDLGWIFWQSIPLLLLKGLLNGETKPDGTTISAASHDSVSYEVEGFEEEVDVPDKIAEYLKSIGNIDGMVSVGVIAQKIVDIVKLELAKLEKEHSVLSVEGTAIDKDTRKVKAFQLFSQGKRPSDPEVKGLGIKPSTAYRYYQEWKKTHNHT